MVEADLEGGDGGETCFGQSESEQEKDLNYIRMRVVASGCEDRERPCRQVLARLG